MRNKIDKASRHSHIDDLSKYTSACCRTLESETRVSYHGKCLATQ